MQLLLPLWLLWCPPHLTPSVSTMEIGESWAQERPEAPSGPCSQAWGSRGVPGASLAPHRGGAATSQGAPRRLGWVLDGLSSSGWSRRPGTRAGTPLVLGTSGTAVGGQGWEAGTPYSRGSSPGQGAGRSRWQRVGHTWGPGGEAAAAGAAVRCWRGGGPAASQAGTEQTAAHRPAVPAPAAAAA